MSAGRGAPRVEPFPFRLLEGLTRAEVAAARRLRRVASRAINLGKLSKELENILQAPVRARLKTVRQATAASLAALPGQAGGSVGVLLAPVLTLTPILQYMGWFLGSLCHETGHVAAAWAMGCPAFPAIRLDGHAAALHREQQPLLVASAIAGLLAIAWASRRRPARLAPCEAPDGPADPALTAWLERAARAMIA